jgi:hypothetical protein
MRHDASGQVLNELNEKATRHTMRRRADSLEKGHVVAMLRECENLASLTSGVTRRHSSVWLAAARLRLRRELLSTPLLLPRDEPI